MVCYGNEHELIMVENLYSKHAQIEITNKLLSSPYFLSLISHEWNSKVMMSHQLTQGTNFEKIKFGFVIIALLMF